MISAGERPQAAHLLRWGNKPYTFTVATQDRNLAMAPRQGPKSSTTGMNISGSW